MNNDLSQPAVPPLVPKPVSRRFSTMLKMAAITVLVLLLLIPLAMVQSVLRERLQRRDEAVREITSTWGREQTVLGPVLIVPYNYERKSWKDQVTNSQMERVEFREILRNRAFFLPASLKAEGALKPDRLHRGIYEAVVYSGSLDMSGSFIRPSFEEWSVDPKQILWDEAEVAIFITDLRGAKESLQIRLAGQMISLKPGAKLPGFDGGVYARVQGLRSDMDSIPFQMHLTLNGSSSLRLAPLGINNDVRIASSWQDPSFQGAFLPTERELTPGGFRARWQIPYYGRSYPQQWTDGNSVPQTAIAASLFGVDLVPGLDSYRYVERSIKYGILCIVLVFTAFFLFEVLSPVRIHPFQYALVGIALCLFYLGLLALSEIWSFSAAYWTGAAAATFMIALYGATTLRSTGRAFLIGIGLALVYAFLFVILRLQDYSLLVGTAGLFLVLALVMYVTRNVDWYARDNG
ncbi:MAG TPA: cell envelope integrity protein CreD [Acidobacteriota bacterium]|nr:cell envelope integrity protein CreD [Acidobacteriota bacterium]